MLQIRLQIYMQILLLRADNPYIYPDGGKQGPHYNADKTYEGKEKLKQHHNYE